MLYVTISQETKAMKSRGLGDTVEKITKATGLKTLTDIASDALGVDCGCKDRRDKWNQLLPYKKL